VQTLLLILLTLITILMMVYWLSPETLVHLAAQAERSRAGLRRHERRAGNFNWAYLDSGGSGEPLVLLHGFGADKDNWNRLARQLRGRFRIIAPDLPGYGESDAPLDARYRVQDQAERLHAFLAALGVTRAHLAGNSMGGYIAALYAATYPANTASLWLINNAGAFSATSSELLKTLESGSENPLIPATLEQFRSLLKMVMSKPPYFPGAVLDVLGRRALAARELRLKQFVDIIEHSPHLEDVLAGLQTPSHILWGDEDRLIHVDCVAVQCRLLPQASHTILRGIGHVPMLEAPVDTARDYLAFHARLQASVTH